MPNLGSWLNRRPAYNLSAAQTGQAEGQVPNASAPPKPSSSVRPPQIPEGDEEKHDALDGEGLSDIQRNTTITSQLSETHYAALPHGETLQGWTEREKAELDDHVRHMLHSRRSKFKRSLKGFSQYVKQPLGFFVTLYATLITIFGLVWVLLIIGWISVSENDNEKKILHIVDSVLVALFAIVGDGMIPWRAMDTYHLCYIMYYVRIIRKARAKSLKKRSALEKAQAELKGLTTTSNSTQATDANGHPVPERRDSYTLANNIQVDIEDARSGINVYEDTPLTPEQQKRLYHHQSKLAKSHSFYRPNETNTHYAFPFNYAIAVIFLLDFHSFLQIALGATTWGIHYQTRHDAITTVILCVSITANIVTGFVITTGGKKTRKKAVWNLMTRQELTGDAIKHLEAKHERQAKKAERKTVAGASKQEKTLKVQLEKEARVQEESGVRADPWA